MSVRGRVSSLGGWTYLDEVLAFWLGDERLELRRREGVHQARLGDDQQQDLCASKD